MSLNRVKRFVIVAALLGILLLLFFIWSFLLRPWQLTKLHGQEMARVVQQFREVRGDLDTRLNPELLLSVATANYYPTFLDWNQVGMCEQCDRFWVVTSVKVRGIRVIEYSSTRSQVRAEIVVYGHRVNSKSYERLMPYDISQSDTATYIFLRETPSNRWMLEDMNEFTVPDLMNPNEIKLDDFLLFDWDVVEQEE